MELKQNILEAMGNTPLVRLNRVTRDLPGELYAKCEFMNPGGSIKDRIGWYMIEKAEKAGTLKPGGTVVESTSGNTGFGLAIAAAIKGYKSVFVLPDKMSEEKRQNLRAFGARVVITPTAVEADSPQSYYSVGKQIAKDTPNALYMNQYHNPDNPETHYMTTGPEIWRQTEGKFDAIVCGMGTCGTISGLGRFFKEKNPKIQIVGVDPQGSILKDLFETGKACEPAQYMIEGIGEDIVPENCDFNVIDKIVRIHDKESYLMTRRLLTQEGLFVGSSSGAAVVGALRYMQETKNPGRVLVILPDSGNRYLSRVFDDAWMIENSFFDTGAERTISDLVRVLHKSSHVVSAKKGDKVSDVAKMMMQEGVSQLPVMHDGEIVGVISEKALLEPLFSETIRATDPIDSLITNKFAVVHPSDKVEWLHEIFSDGKIALVQDGGQIQYILTNIDLISFLSLHTK